MSAPEPCWVIRVTIEREVGWSTGPGNGDRPGWSSTFGFAHRFSNLSDAYAMKQRLDDGAHFDQVSIEEC
jgi:hypothetical protein